MTKTRIKTKYVNKHKMANLTLEHAGVSFVATSSITELTVLIIIVFIDEHYFITTLTVLNINM